MSPLIIYWSSILSAYGRRSVSVVDAVPESELVYTERAAVLTDCGSVFLFSYGRNTLSKCCYMFAEGRLQIGCLVLVDDIGLRQLVQHLLHGRIELGSLILIRHITQLANSITHSLCIVSVVQRPDFVLTDSRQ